MARSGASLRRTQLKVKIAKVQLDLLRGDAEGKPFKTKWDDFNKSQLESHEEVNYRQGSKNQHCSICTMYVKEGPRCTAVESPIGASMLCDLFQTQR